MQALERSGQRGIVLKGWGAIVPERLPETILAIDAVPHDWLFPRVGAIVHHGGAGTTGAGLRAGRPSLVVPFIGDQSFWGRQVYARGLGPRPLDQDGLSVQALAAAITTMLTDRGMWDRAAAMGEQIRAEDGPAAVVHLVEERVRPSYPLWS